MLTGISKYTSSPHVRAHELTGSAAAMARAVGVSNNSAASAVTLKSIKIRVMIGWSVDWGLRTCNTDIPRSRAGCRASEIGIALRSTSEQHQEAGFSPGLPQGSRPQLFQTNALRGASFFGRSVIGLPRGATALRGRSDDACPRSP